MTEFRARLRKPKSELWLGCRISSVIMQRSNTAGWMLVVNFDNCPFPCYVLCRFIETVRSNIRQHARKDVVPLRIGEMVNVDVDWRSTDSKRWMANAKICWKSFFAAYGLDYRNV